MYDVEKERRRARWLSHVLGTASMLVILAIFACLVMLLADQRKLTDAAEKKVADLVADSEPASIVLMYGNAKEQDWYEVANEFCIYMEEDLRDCEGSLWDLLCLGVNGRTKEDFDAFFSPGLRDGTCPSNYVCGCK